MAGEWTVEGEGARLDVFLAGASGLTRSRVERLIRDGLATVDGQAQRKPGLSLKAEQRVCLRVPAARPIEVAPQDLNLRVVYQDRDLAVVYKPAGMVVHPAAGNPDGTLVNALLACLDDLSGIGGVLRPGIVHRIDKDTSGLLLVAKNDRSHLSLSAQFKAHAVERAYLAIVVGRLKALEGDICAPIGRHPTQRKRMAVVPEGREARTHYQVLRALRGATLIRATLSTGRTHQIRVHMASIGHPVLGDPVYGPRKSPHPVHGGQLLHAATLGFDHPATGERLRFEAPPEARFDEWLRRLSAEDLRAE